MSRRDCNECIHMTLTETQQKRLSRAQRNKSKGHYCDKLKLDIKHDNISSGHSPYLQPHILCNEHHFFSRLVPGNNYHANKNKLLGLDLHDVVDRGLQDYPDAEFVKIIYRGQYGYGQSPDRAYTVVLYDNEVRTMLEIDIALSLDILGSYQYRDFLPGMIKELHAQAKLKPEYIEMLQKKHIAEEESRN